MKRRKRLVLCIVTLLLLAGAFVAERVLFTMPWDVTWVHRGTALTLDTPDLSVSGTELTSLLNQLHADDSARWGLRCTLNERRGKIEINGNMCPVRVIDDKFTGESIIVEERWKTVELFRGDAANHGLQLTGDARE